MAAFQKWVHSGGDGKSVEATLRLTRVTEELHKDGGKFKTWSKVLAHFGNAEDAERFRSLRRSQSKGTSVCRNTGEECMTLCRRCCPWILHGQISKACCYAPSRTSLLT